jgi:hypothetical protein
VWQYPATGHYYQQFDVNLTPQNALRWCATRGGYVVAIGDAQENQFLAGMLRTIGKRSTFIGLTISKRVWITHLGDPIRSEIYGRWTDGKRFAYRYNSEPAAPGPVSSFSGFGTTPTGPHVFMNLRGVWSADQVATLLVRTTTETAAPYKIETYTVKNGVSSVTCEWNTSPPGLK